METSIRQTKRRIIAYDGAGAKDMMTAESIKLRLQRNEYEKFSNVANLRVMSERHQVLGYNRIISSKSVGASKKYENFSSAINVLNIKDNGKVKNISIHFVNQAHDRKVHPMDIVNALKAPLDIGDLKLYDLGRKSVRFIGENATIEINPDTNNLVTVWKTGKRIRK